MQLPLGNAADQHIGRHDRDEQPVADEMGHPVLPVQHAAHGKKPHEQSRKTAVGQTQGQPYFGFVELGRHPQHAYSSKKQHKNVNGTCGVQRGTVRIFHYHFNVRHFRIHVLVPCRFIQRTHDARGAQHCSDAVYHGEKNGTKKFQPKTGPDHQQHDYEGQQFTGAVEQPITD